MGGGGAIILFRILISMEKTIFEIAKLRVPSPKYISISSFIEKTGLTCLQQKKKFVNTSIKISSMTEIYFYRFKSELRKFEIELQSILPCS